MDAFDTEQPPDDPESQEVRRARSGDHEAFERLVAPHRGPLQGYCYSMLGSVHDAEDVLQDALLRAWRHLDSFQGRAGFRTWLHRIVTNTCLTALERRRRRDLPVDLAAAEIDAAAAAEPVRWLEPFPTVSWPVEQVELRESVELAFAAALQHLPPRQRAVLVLRDVLGFSAAEAGDVLGATPTAVHSALQHARTSVQARIPARSQQTALASLGDPALRDLVGRYARAFEEGDVETIVSLLTSDATWSMPPSPACFRGPDDIAAFLTEEPLRHRWRHLSTSVNAQAALACYAWDPPSRSHRALVVDVLTVRADRICAVTAFPADALLRPLGLPVRL